MSGSEIEKLARSWELDAAQHRGGTMGTLRDIRDREYAAGLCEMHARDIRDLAKTSDAGLEALKHVRAFAEWAEADEEGRIRINENLAIIEAHLRGTV